jgi:hypothetical protein
MTSPATPSYFRNNRNGGTMTSSGGGASRIFKLSCITMFALLGYNVIVKSSSSSSSSQKMEEFERADMFAYDNNNYGQQPSPFGTDSSASVFDEGDYDSQAPLGLQGSESQPQEFQQSSAMMSQSMEGEDPTEQQTQQSSSLRGVGNSEVWSGNAMESQEEGLSVVPPDVVPTLKEYYDTQTQATEADVYAPEEGVVDFIYITPEGVEEIVDLEYVHCGPTYTLGANDFSRAEEDIEETKIIHEIILLHGAKFTKDDWKTYGILEQLCDPSAAAGGGGDGEDADNTVSASAVSNNNHYFSVVALDLSVEVDGLQLAHAFESLSSAGVVSGMPATFVTPSASGKGMVDLAELSRHADEEIAKEGTAEGQKRVNLLQSMVQAWIPFACPAVQTAEGSTLNEFSKGKIPVLGMYGYKDTLGKEVADKLEAVAHAKVMVLGENHPGYLDDPKKFVHTLKIFMTNLDTWFVDE